MVPNHTIMVLANSPEMLRWNLNLFPFCMDFLPQFWVLDFYHRGKNLSHLPSRVPFCISYEGSRIVGRDRFPPSYPILGDPLVAFSFPTNLLHLLSFADVLHNAANDFFFSPNQTRRRISDDIVFTLDVLDTEIKLLDEYLPATNLWASALV